MNPFTEKRAIDAFVVMIVDRLEARGEPAAELTIAAAERGIFPTSVEAFGALEVLTRIGLVAQRFGIVVPGPHFLEVKSRRAASRLLLS